MQWKLQFRFGGQAGETNSMKSKRALRPAFPLVLGLRLHLIATPFGLPIAHTPTTAKTDKRNTAVAMLELDTALAERPGQILMAAEGHRSASFEAELDTDVVTLIRPTFGKEPDRLGQQFLRRFRQIIESINQSLKAHWT